VIFVSEEKKYKRGLTWRSLLALMYIVFVFQPGLAYLQLMTGSAPAASAIQWATILLFYEISSLSGSPLTLPEAIIIFLGSTQTIKYWWFLSPTMTNLGHPGWIYQAYLKHSPIAKALDIADKIPYFYAPVSIEPWIKRTFFHPDWRPIVLCTLIYFIAALCGDIAVNIFAYQLYVVIEKLPFPLAMPVVSGTRALLGREWRRMGFLSVSALISAVYAFMLYVFPLISRVLWRVSVSFIPVPWIDYNLMIQRIFPGSSFGIATDLVAFATGFIIPFQASLGMLIGSFALYFIGNYILVTRGITGFAQEYSYGMSIQSTWQRSYLYAWAMPAVGMGLAIGIAPLLLHPNLIINAFKTLRRFSTSAIGISPLWFICPFIASTIAITTLDYVLAPDFPLPLYVFLNTLWPFVSVLILARAEGVGVGLGVPYVRELTIKASGYHGMDAWFVPIYQASSWATSFKICEMTRTSPKDYIVSMVIIFPLALLFGVLTIQSFWSLAPIPSAIYPGVLYSWPVQATLQTIFISPKAEEFFQVPRLLYGFITGTLLYFLGDRFNFVPLVIGIAGGMSAAIPSPTSTFIGAVVGKLVERALGKARWDEYKNVIFAGILLGEGLIVTIGTGIAIVIRSMWAWPY